MLQCEVPKIHVMLRMIQTFARKPLGRCIKAEALTIADLTSVNVDDQDNFLPADRVMIGFITRSIMTSQDFSSQEKRVLTEHCQLFMVEAYKYAMSHLPIHDPVLRHAVLQFDDRHTANFDSLVFFVEKFPSLKVKLEGNTDKLYDHFTDYQGLQDRLADDYERIDHMCLRFNLLFDVVKYILLLPHSNAEEERIFSMVAKNKTKFRASLSNKMSLPSILSCKVNCFNHTDCFQFQLSKWLLEKAKKQLHSTMLTTVV